MTMIELIDGVPLFNDPTSDAFFSSQGITNNELDKIKKGASASKKFPYASASADFPFNRTVKDSIDTFFPEAKHIKNDHVEFYIDPECECDPEELQKMYSAVNVATGDFSNSLTLKVLFKLTVFVSKYFVKLDEAFRCTSPEPNEIIIYLEDNRGDLSGTYAKVKVGKDVAKNLASTKTEDISNAIRADQMLNPDANRELIAKLIQDGLAEKTPASQTGILAVIQNVDFITSTIKIISYDVNIKAQNLIIDSINYFRIAEKHWNPKAEREEADGQFSPFFFPFSEIAIEKIDELLADEELVKKGVDNVKRTLLEIDERIANFIQSDDNLIDISLFGVLDIKAGIVPEVIRKELMDAYSQVSTSILAKIDELYNVDLIGIFKQNVNSINAFLCGIVNGMLDSIVGYFEIMKLFYEVLKRFEELRMNNDSTIAVLLELRDDALRTILEINYVSILAAVARGMLQITPGNLVKIQPELLAYFTGMVIGYIIVMILEIIIGILLTGGTLSVAAVVKELVSVLTALPKLAYHALKAVYNAGKFVLKSIISAIRGLVKFMTTDNFVKIIDDIFKWINEVLLSGKAETALDKEIIKIIGRKGYDKVQKLGLQIRKNDNVYELVYDGIVIQKGDAKALQNFWLELKRTPPSQRSKFLAKALNDSLKLSNEGEKMLVKWADDAIKLFKLDERPSAVTIIEKNIDGRPIRRIGHSNKKGLAQGELPDKLHLLVEDWLKNASETLRARPTHGKCAEIATVSDYLLEIDEFSKMTILEARNELKGFTCQTRKIGGKRIKIKDHGKIFKACDTCDPFLHDFGIKEIY